MRGAPHNSDQWEIYSRNEYRTALLERADVEANTERRVTLEWTWPGRRDEGKERRGGSRSRASHRHTVGK